MPIMYPDTILDSDDVVMNKMDKIPVFMELVIYQRDRQEANKYIYVIYNQGYRLYIKWSQN